LAEAWALAAAPESGPAAWTVSQLTALVKGVLEEHPALRDFWVEGEISNFKLHTSGHLYFTLKDEGATLRCVMFRSRAQRLPFRPSNGLKVLLRGEIGVFPRDGSYQCYAQEIQPAGLGALHLAYEQLKARLAAQGLFDAAAKRPLPKLPRRVVLVTSPTGAALRDMIRIASRRCPSVELVLVPALVQGPEAPDSLVRALQLAPSLGPDVVVVGRGGGSLEELWAFNDEAVARAIRACPVPVVSAVGHETDFTIADFAADCRAPTPSGAAELVVPDRAALLGELQACAAAAAQALRVGLQRRRQRLQHLAARGPLARREALFAAQRTRLAHASVRLATAGRGRVQDARRRWEATAARLHALSPLAVLGRGFAVCRLPDGRVVRDAAQAPVGGAVEVLVERGRLHARVEGHAPGLELPLGTDIP
jgi:exodeoxyribonuclease VII large subunit